MVEIWVIGLDLSDRKFGQIDVLNRQVASNRCRTSLFNNHQTI